MGGGQGKPLESSEVVHKPPNTGTDKGLSDSNPNGSQNFNANKLPNEKVRVLEEG